MSRHVDCSRKYLSCLVRCALEKGDSGTGTQWKKHVGRLCRREQIFFKVFML